MMHVYPNDDFPSSMEQASMPLSSSSVEDLIDEVKPSRSLSERFDDWLIAHENSWYLKPLEVFGKLHAGGPLQIKLPSDLKNSLSEKYSAFVARRWSDSRYHESEASAYVASGQYARADWHRFLGAASRWPPFSRAG
jgi:hypothetical protein